MCVWHAHALCSNMIEDHIRLFRVGWNREREREKCSNDVAEKTMARVRAQATAGGSVQVQVGSKARQVMIAGGRSRSDEGR